MPDASGGTTTTDPVAQSTRLRTVDGMPITLAPLLSSNSDEWHTPPHFFAELARRWNFTFDPCSSVRFPATCARWCGLDHPNPSRRDGLTADWLTEAQGGHVWCNPPYSDIKGWMAKATDEAARGVTSVFLVPARTDTKWFHGGLRTGTVRTVTFVEGRLRFGDGKGGAPFPSMVVEIGPGAADTPAFQTMTSRPAPLTLFDAA